MRSATATKMRSCSSVIGCRQPPSWSEHRLDQPEAEQRDEQRRGGAERQRAQALGAQLADVGFQPHGGQRHGQQEGGGLHQPVTGFRSEEHTSELQSLMRISYAVFCLKKKKKTTHNEQH